jgi:hypothetical protein
MRKTKCVSSFRCEVCGILGLLQVIGSYRRVRHYIGLDPETKKPKYHYHKQSREHVDRILRELDLNRPKNVDLNNAKIGSFSENKRAGSLVWIGRKPPKLAVVGSNATPPVLDEPSHLGVTTLLSF